MNVNKDQTAARVAALQSERAGLAARKLKDRVAQVDAELAALGVEVEAPKVEAAVADGGPEKAVQERPARRGGR